MASKKDDANKQIGDYLVQKELGKGESSRVYLAHKAHQRNILVAIKVFDFDKFTSQDAKDHFFESILEEAEIFKRLVHPAILKFERAGIYNNRPYFIMEYAPGGSLRDRLNRSQPELQEAINILINVGQALSYAHQQHVIHRDLKPENILFNGKDEALLADFGIATRDDIKHTRTKPIGIRPYMSPEELQDRTTEKSDQYALGIIAYELFTGQLPFAELQAIKAEEPKPPRQYNSELPAYIETAILIAIEKQEEKRHEGIDVFIAALKKQPSRNTILEKKSEKKQQKSKKRTTTFDVFLSVSVNDQDWVERELADRLEKEGLRVWFKKWMLTPGRSERDTIAQGLKQSKSFAICIGSEIPQNWVDKEVQQAQDRQAQDSSFSVIPVYLDPPSKEFDLKFLNLNVPVYFSNKDDFDYAFHLLVCGIKGVSPGRWEPKKSTVQEEKSITKTELEEVQSFIQEKLIDETIAKEKQRQLLQRSLANDGSIESRLKEVQRLMNMELLGKKEAEEKRRQILEDL